MKLESIVLEGEVRGRIWMPAVECTKHFRETFTPEDRPFTGQWAGLRSALIRITDDGDFQSCGISEECYMEIHYRLPNGDTLTKHASVRPCKAIADLFAD
jgi:hypothetical protein